MTGSRSRARARAPRYHPTDPVGYRVATLLRLHPRIGAGYPGLDLMRLSPAAREALLAAIEERLGIAPGTQDRFVTFNPDYLD